MSDAPEEHDSSERPPESADDADGGERHSESPGASSESTPEGPEEKLLASLNDFKDELQDEVRGLVRAKKAAEQLCRDGAVDNLQLVRKYTDWLRRSDLGPVGLDERREQAVDALETYVDHRRRRRRHDFLAQLNGAAGEDLAFEKLAENPLTLFLSPFVVAVDFETGDARLEYAKSTVAETDLDPESLLERHEREARRLREDAVDSTTFFERLHRAYEMARLRRDLEPGARVDLVALRAPLGLMHAEVDAWRGPEREAIADYPDHLYSYQLQQLRRDGLLEHDGWRIDLGTATGGSTEDKDDVLFIPSGRGEGQYYLSIRFQEAT